MSWRDGPAAAKWVPVLNATEAHYGIPHDLLARECYQESRFDPHALNPSGAVGLMQLLPKYFPGAGANPLKDIDSGGAYLRHLYTLHHDWQLALACYDWGPGNVDKWLKAGAVWQNMPTETRVYVTQITADVPVGGSLCKTQKSPTVGLLTNPSSAVPSLGPPPPKSWLQSVITSLKPHSTGLQAAPLPASASPSLPISFPIPPTVNKETTMSTPNPALVAASPFLKTVLTNLKAAISTTLTGDPAQIGLRAGPAFSIFLNQVMLAEPSLVAAEEGVVNTDLNSKIDGLIAKLP